MVIDLKFIDEDKCVLTGPNGYLQKHSIIMYLGTRLRVFPWQEHTIESGRFYTFLFNERCVGFHEACSEDLGLFQPFSEPVLEGT